MSYPTLEQYQESLQNPKLSLLDPELKNGSIKTTGLGLPLALCGGFALTYTVTCGSKKYAVRCFHKVSKSIDIRYKAISHNLRILNSSYFVAFDFQPKGVQVNGRGYPVVKMSWATGVTLGEFLEKNYNTPKSIQNLSLSLRKLASFLESHEIAHGDIQPGNLMVSKEGQDIQLIDYDGIYVNSLKDLGSSELGQRNFQHPNRTASHWNSTLDRFSFISILFALRAIELYPDLWVNTQSDSDAILFKANDFSSPERSPIFNELYAHAQLLQDAKNLTAICKAPFEKIPTLEDFLAKRNIPSALVAISTTALKKPAAYISPYPVLDASVYSLCLNHVGDRVELIGKIVEVKEGQTRFGKPFVFINFGSWRGETVKINIWSGGLATLTKIPDKSWIGKWISVVGLMDPPYLNKRYKYSHLSITCNQSTQIHLISEDEAKYRLGIAELLSTEKPSGANNRSILSDINKNAKGQNPQQKTKTATTKPTTSRNAQILQKMKAGQSAPVQTTAGTASTKTTLFTGTSQPTNLKTCDSCNATIPSSVDFCPNCGVIQSGQTNKDTTDKKKTKSGCLTWIVLGIVLLVAYNIFL